MKRTLISLAGLAMFSAAMATAGQPQDSVSTPDVARQASATVPFKARVAGELATAVADRRANGTVELIFSVYDRATEGNKLFEETQAVHVNGANLYADIGAATTGGIPANLLQSHPNIWLEVSRPSAPSIALDARQKISFKTANSANASPNAIVISVDPSLCYTCGGQWPYLVGSWSTPTPGAYERPAGCNGNLYGATDTRPYLCSR